MNIKVMYHSKTGNTKKVADAIAEAVGASAELISENTTADSADLLFIGDGVYTSRLDKQTLDFIKTLDSSKVKYAAVFITYGRKNDRIALSLKQLLQKQGINVLDEHFGCKGKTLFIFNRKSPDEQDLAAAKEFAKGVAEKVK